MQATRRVAPAGPGQAEDIRRDARQPWGAESEEPHSAGLRVAGAIALVVLLAALAILCVDAAAAPSQYVPGDSGGWPGWLSGPLSGIGSQLGKGGFQALVLTICAGYVVALAAARALPFAALVSAVIAAHVILLLGPPLISQDVFGYLAFARMGALHGLDPYTHFPAQAATDPVFTFIGWPFQHSPYGPLFTLASYAAAPLGLAGGLWALKALTTVASLGAIWLTAEAAGRLGRSRTFALAFLGLNPVLLVFAVGGAHNDTLLLLAVGVALLLSAPRAAASSSPGRPRAAALALAGGVGVKLTAGLLLPFLVLGQHTAGERWRVALAGAVGLVAVAAVGVIGFGPHALGFLGAVGEQQQLVATHSVPAETARLVGLHGVPAWWRHAWIAVFVVVLGYALWRTARGADWRVAAGWTTIALLCSTAWLLPWYAVWPLPLAAVCGDRRLLAATLVVCAYAVLIHLPLADPLLSPGHARTTSAVPARAPSPGVGDGLEFTRLEVLRDTRLDLRR
jgi:alpha-1,6-mannosyltransferase